MQLQDITKEAVIISEADSFTDILRRMLTEQTNSVLVIDEDGKLSGEISVSDLFDAVIPHSFDGDDVLAHLADEAAFKAAVQDAGATQAIDFMSADFDAVYLDSNIMEVAATAIAHGRARVPVVDHDDRPVGVISRRGLKDILKNFLTH